ncbi:glycosyltransferase family 1 protein [Mesorhizobium sp. M00.F.Ca.ET.216.01.1.1]|uniref:glycosyltransferase family 1 protein n=1 Tax=Mesorhizobium sp. M00.F.Ca.ET.216.01.1.1 TaxID=2500528 RepID=UPI000FD81197|nr:glycosyltransferase family 1 protein [Mesorhizobium sp. M00.F.Ca.ET.216.01.1.1]TGQ35675.1 glycosyltransferase family 1 protein [Mesorhizobium sp. M00.F.Ca.ET.216.01.1.1]
MDQTVSNPLLVPFDNPLLICFSHLRWDFVFQRPQHLMTRAAEAYSVVFFEEPVFEPVQNAFLRRKSVASGLQVVTPVLPHDQPGTQIDKVLAHLLDNLVADIDHDQLVTWYYTPMALKFAAALQDDVCVYDCMDELSAFKDAPPELELLERQLFRKADVVFTGGMSLYEAKRSQHPFVHAFPSSIDTAHFHQARRRQADPADQQTIPRPRVGFFGVVDERFDIDLMARTAAAMPDVQFVTLGPVVKIDPATLPSGPNIHWLGAKRYAELPSYMAGWDVGWMPFALNEATRYISPTKTPEFLAGALPVVSTAIVDVVQTYGRHGLVQIADAASMPAALRMALRKDGGDMADVDAFLSRMSWDATWGAMRDLLTPANLLPATSNQLADYV